LDKLRYMRGPEPFAGYDALDMDAVLARIEDVDMATIKKVRSYEAKFANRAAILDAVVEIHHRLQSARPAKPVPAYQSMGGASV
jgi:predicted nucleotidyltransferase